MASTLKKRVSRGGDAGVAPCKPDPKPPKRAPRLDDAENAAPEEDDSAWGAVASVWRKLTDDSSAVEAAVVDKVRRRDGAGEETATARCRARCF